MSASARSVLVCLALACGPANPGTTDEPASTGAAATSAAPTSTGAPVADLPPSCGEFRDDQAGEGVPIRIRNVGPADVFLHSDCHERRWELRAGDDPQAYFPGPLFCAPLTCETALGDRCERFCPLPCSRRPTLRLAPGGVFEDMWPQLLHEAVELPAECGGCGACVRLRRVAAGELVTLSIRTTAAVTCAAGEPCTCTPDAMGVCEIAGVLDGEVAEIAELRTFDGSPIVLELGG